MYATSPVIRRHMAENAPWFSERLHEIVATVDPAVHAARREPVVPGASPTSAGAADDAGAAGSNS
jgi:hypothetical protein